MNKKQEVFINEYLKDFNGTRAYKVAYKSCKKDGTARANACKLLANPNIQKAIQEQSDKQLDELHIDVNYIVRNIKEVTERCMQKEPVEYFDKIDKCWKPLTEEVELPNGEIIEARVMKFDAGNSLKGLELLGKYKSIFNDNLKLSGNISHTEQQKNAIDDIVAQMKPVTEDDT